MSRRKVASLFALLPCALAAQPAPPAARRVALVIGNSAYAGADQLRNPANDAELTGATLRRLGFSTTILRNRSGAMLRADIAAFAHDAHEADIALLYYAGHGAAVQGVNYLLPVDTSLQRISALALQRDGTSLRSVESDLAAARPKVLVMVIDACRDPVTRGTPLPSGLTAAPIARGVLQFFSTQPGARALDGTGANSPFAIAFNQQLADTALTLKQVVERTRKQVADDTHDMQVPWGGDGLVGDVRLASAGALAALPAVPGRMQDTTRGLQSDPASSRAFWSPQLDDREYEVETAVTAIDRPSLASIIARDKAGDVVATTILGRLYLDDTPLTRKDVLRALTYLRRAANRGFPIAMTLLGELYAQGTGVPRDFEKADKLLSDASAAGHSRARLDLISIKTQRGQTPNQQELKDAAMNIMQTLQHQVQQAQQPHP